MATSLSIDCGDFLEFQDTLHKMRKIDDQIIFALNSIIPTETFKKTIDPSSTCKELHQQITNIHNKRETSIKDCRDISREEIEQLKKQRAHDPDNAAIQNKLQVVQNTLRRLESELDIENILKNRTYKIYNDKCRSYYKNSNLKDL